MFVPNECQPAGAEMSDPMPSRPGSRTSDRRDRPTLNPMTSITIFTIPPSTVCARIANFLEARGFEYELVTVEGDAEMTALSEKSGRMSCPIVYVGEVLVGGAKETVEAHASGELARLTGTTA
jgi:glutaredoxin